MGKLSKSELKTFKEQEEKKQAILHDLGLLATQSHTLSHMFAELSMKQEQNKKELGLLQQRGKKLLTRMARRKL